MGSPPTSLEEDGRPGQPGASIFIHCSLRLHPHVGVRSLECRFDQQDLLAFHGRVPSRCQVMSAASSCWAGASQVGPLSHAISSRGRHDRRQPSSRSGIDTHHGPRRGVGCGVVVSRFAVADLPEQTGRNLTPWPASTHPLAAAVVGAAVVGGAVVGGTVVQAKTSSMAPRGIESKTISRASALSKIA